MRLHRQMVLAIAVLAILCMVVAVACADDYYVDASAAGGDTSGDGSETKPWQTVAYALSWISTNDPGSVVDPHTIHIAAGTYDSSIGESYPLTMQSYVSLSGEDEATTILDAENNAYHVIYCDSANNFTIENLTITGGNADGTYPDYQGGGIYCYYSSPTLTDCTVSGNTARINGGGISCSNSSSPTLTDCTIESNEAGYGGGIHCDGSSPTLTNCAISDNVGRSWGGGINADTSSPKLTNCLITRNTAEYGGGGMCFWECCSPAFVNCTIADNDADYDGDGNGDGGGVYFDDICGEPEFKNCILWGDIPDEIYGDTPTVTYSDVEGGWSGTGNIDEDPLFVPHDEYGEHTGYYLAHVGPQAGDSPCLDAGTGAVADYGMEGTTTCTDGSADGDDDADGQTGPIDMGYHYPEGYGGNEDTYIELVSFTARPGDESIILVWETGAEIDNAGFVLFRTIAGAQDVRQISDLIAAEGTPAYGASYTFTDTNVERGVTYNYWLVDIETTGKWTAHGPASARLGMDLKLIDHQSAFAQGYGGQAANVR